jgi:hypothetical protein
MRLHWYLKRGIASPWIKLTAELSRVNQYAGEVVQKLSNLIMADSSNHWPTENCLPSMPLLCAYAAPVARQPVGLRLPPTSETTLKRRHCSLSLLLISHLERTTSFPQIVSHNVVRTAHHAR